MVRAYYIGNQIKIIGTFTDTSGSPVDPSTVTAVYKDPSGAETTLTYALGQITRDSTGVYHYLVTANLSGRWYYKWTGGGTNTVVDENNFDIIPSQL